MVNVTLVVLKILKAREGYTHSEETKEKMRQTAIKKNRVGSIMTFWEEKKRVIVDDLGIEFASLTEAANHYGG